MIVRLHELALAEIDAASDWYEAQRPGLGVELEDEIDRALALIEQFPFAARSAGVNRRVAVLPRFPYTLPYRIDGETVVVLALAHTSRRPYYWRMRR